MARTSRSILATCGPPNEWTGTIAGALTPEERREALRTWRSLSATERAKFQQDFDKAAGARIDWSAQHATTLHGSVGRVQGMYKLLMPKKVRDKADRRVESAVQATPVLRDVDKVRRRAKAEITELRKHARFLSPEKRKARRRVDQYHEDASDDRWDSFLRHAQRKSYAKALARDPRTDKKLARHADQMNRLLTGKPLESVLGKTGTYEITRLRGGGVGCTCNDWRYRRSVASPGEQDCKHIKAWKAERKIRSNRVLTSVST